MKLDAMTIGERIRLLRTARKMTQGQLAKMLKVGRNLVSQWELGNVTPSEISRAKLVKLFGAPMSGANLDRKQRLQEARDTSVEKAMQILKNPKAKPGEYNAANMAIARAAEAEARISGTPNEDIRERMKGAREEFLRKLARLKLDEG